MRCINPTDFPHSYGPVACGSCIPCRITKRTRWRTRLLLENKYWSGRSIFLTLTYAPEFLLETEFFPAGNLDKSVIQKFIKRLRRAFHRVGDDREVRYYAVGEYGEKSQRAHYHIILFNVDLYDELIVRSCWKFGHLHFGESNKNTIAYTLGYTLKKLTSEKDFPDGRQPEFALMSQGLGARYLEPIVQRLASRKLYPARAFSEYEKFYVEHTAQLPIDLGFKPWDGTFVMDGVRCSFDSFIMKKLAALFSLLDLSAVQFSAVDDLDAYFSLKGRWRARKDRLTHFAFLAKIAFKGDEAYEKACKEADKILRQSKDRHSSI